MNIKQELDIFIKTIYNANNKTKSIFKEEHYDQVIEKISSLIPKTC